MLLFSGATPAVPERLRWMAAIMPLPLVEASHFTRQPDRSSAAGARTGHRPARRRGVLHHRASRWPSAVPRRSSRAVTTRKRSCWRWSWPHLVSARRHFTRRARILEWPLPARWIAAIATAIAASVWLGLFAYRHVAYRSDLWWRFAVDANAPRFLRASVGVTIAALAIVIRLLLGTARPKIPAIDAAGPTPELDRVIALQPRTLPYLVYLGDKAVLWNADQTAFVMYAVSGSTCVALGDPVGPSDARRDLVRRFIAMSESLSLAPAFYQVSAGAARDLRRRLARGREAW